MNHKTMLSVVNLLCEKICTIQSIKQYRVCLLSKRPLYWLMFTPIQIAYFVNCTENNGRPEEVIKFWIHHEPLLQLKMYSVFIYCTQIFISAYIWQRCLFSLSLRMSVFLVILDTPSLSMFISALNDGVWFSDCWSETLRGHSQTTGTAIPAS